MRVNILFAGILSGCPAEQLGIELPPPGGASISMEDVQRDTRGASGPDWRPFVARRLREMHLVVSEGPPLCGVRGSGTERAFVVPEPVGVDGAAAVAVLIGLAKAADTSEGNGAWRFCVGEAEGLRLGPFGRGALSDDGTRAGPVDPARRLEGVDYRDLAEIAQGVWARHGAP